MIGKLNFNDVSTADDLIIFRVDEGEQSINLVSEMCKKLKNGFDKGKLAVIDIKWYFKHRTPSQNSYYWALIEKLGNELRINKELVHIDMLQKYGQGAFDKNGNKLIFSIRADISPEGILKYSKEIGDAVLEVNGEKVNFKHYRALKGSSELDTREMTILIDGLISECQDYGIQTDTPEQLALLKESWVSDEK